MRQVNVKYRMLKKIAKVFLLIQIIIIVVYLVNFNRHIKNSDWKDLRRSLEETYKHGTNSKRVFDKVGASGDILENIEVSPENVTVRREICPKFTFPKLLPTDSTWVPADENRFTFVYAAYHVTRNGNNKIVIIGAKKAAKRKYTCQFWYRNNETQDSNVNFVPATSQTLLESHGKRYSAAFFECRINSELVPKYVSIVTGNCSKPKNILVVQSATSPPEYERKFTVCLSPLHLQYSRAFELVGWIELNRILGADKFIVYNQSVASNVSHVLDYYSKMGVVEVLSWNLPMSVPDVLKTNRPPEIHYFGQVVALNDCLYRNKKFSKFVVNIDLDEFIIPRPNKLQTWQDLINILPRNDVYLVLNTFFSSMEHKSTIRDATLIDKYHIVTLQNLKREERVFKARIRSKYFAQTSKVFRLMIHEVRDARASNVPKDIALLHHYPKSLSDDNQQNVYDDTLSVKYRDKLISSIEQTWTRLGHEYKLKL